MITVGRDCSVNNVALTVLWVIGFAFYMSAFYSKLNTTYTLESEAFECKP